MRLDSIQASSVILPSMDRCSNFSRSILRSGLVLRSVCVPVWGAFLVCILLAVGATAQNSRSSRPQGKDAPKQDDALQKHFDAARTFQIGGDQEHAATEYRAFLAEALRRVAGLRTRLGEYDKAAKVFEAALAVAPEDPDLHLNFSAMRFEQGQFVEAKSLAEKTLQLQPNNSSAHYLLGRVLFQQGDFPAAKEHLEAAVVGTPNFETGYLLGITYLKLNDLSRADLCLMKWSQAWEIQQKFTCIWGARTEREVSWNARLWNFKRQWSETKLHRKSTIFSAWLC